MDDKMKFILALSAGAALLMIGADWLKKVDLPAAKAPDPEVMTILDKPPVVKRSKKKSRVKPTTEWIRRDKLGIRAMALRPRGATAPALLERLSQTSTAPPLLLPMPAKARKVETKAQQPATIQVATTRRSHCPFGAVALIHGSHNIVSSRAG